MIGLATRAARVAACLEKPPILDSRILKVDMRNRQPVKMIGRFIVADPKICHGKPTFRGTRILVADVLEQVASGVAWETIVSERGDAISADAIAEALRMPHR